MWSPPYDPPLPGHSGRSRLIVILLRYAQFLHSLRLSGIHPFNTSEREDGPSVLHGHKFRE
jgi:hypothetical protein